MALDKWQQREALKLSEEKGVTYDEAVAELYPPAPAPEPEPEPEPKAESKAAKLTK